MARTILEYFRASKAKYSSRTVYSDRDRDITFEELYKMACSVGTAIARIERPERPVAVLTGRHVHTPACYLGIAMAGCFYAPMDASMPDARLRQILGVIDADYLLTDRDNAAKAEEIGYKGTILLLEDIIETEADEDLLRAAEEEITEISPLYVLFTSGSTGVPKGVLTSHHAMICYLEGLQDVIRMDESDVIGNQAPLDYIAAIRDMYLPLMTGARTVIIPQSEFAMPEQLFASLRDNGVTTLCWSTTGLEIPAKLGVFEEDDSKLRGLLPPLKRVVFSGSVISNIYLRMWQEAFPQTVFINQYGPTEATGSCSYHVIDKLIEKDDVIPIGRPYKNYQIALITEDQKEAEAGEVGEICVLGPALALGYYNSPEQTGKQFTKDPRGGSWPRLIYRTGDLGKREDDGLLYFLGRMDRQFKHMGHRIEPEEIEQKVLMFEGVEECSCAYDKAKQTICLFYSGDAAGRDLTIYLRGELPSFMVPRRIKNMEELPHLPNGKVDRKKLQESLAAGDK